MTSSRDLPQSCGVISCWLRRRRRRQKKAPSDPPRSEAQLYGRGREVHTWHILTGAVARRPLRHETAGGNAGRCLWWARSPRAPRGAPGVDAVERRPVGHRVVHVRHASSSGSLEFVFPAARLCRDARFGPPTRFHLHASAIQGVVTAAGPPRSAYQTCRTFRILSGRTLSKRRSTSGTPTSAPRWSTRTS